MCSEIKLISLTHLQQQAFDVGRIGNYWLTYMYKVYIYIIYEYAVRAESKNRLGVKKHLKVVTDIFIVGCWYLH